MTQNKLVLNRRELLKAITALGSAVAANSLLPDKWAKPEMGVGVLPAHAQSTLRCVPPYEIVRCEINAQQEGNKFTGTTSAWIFPPCPGILLRPLIIVRVGFETPAKPIIFDFVTDSEGKATGNFAFEYGTKAPSVRKIELWIKAVWEFINPNDGSGSCETEKLYFTTGVGF